MSHGKRILRGLYKMIAAIVPFAAFGAFIYVAGWLGECIGGTRGWGIGVFIALVAPVVLSFAYEIGSEP